MEPILFYYGIFLLVSFFSSELPFGYFPNVNHLDLVIRFAIIGRKSEVVV